jgi:hypothetical protein
MDEDAVLLLGACSIFCWSYLIYQIFRLFTPLRTMKFDKSGRLAADLMRQSPHAPQAQFVRSVLPVDLMITRLTRGGISEADKPDVRHFRKMLAVLALCALVLIALTLGALKAPAEATGYAADAIVLAVAMVAGAVAEYRAKSAAKLIIETCETEEAQTRAAAEAKRRKKTKGSA